MSIKWVAKVHNSKVAANYEISYYTGWWPSTCIYWSLVGLGVVFSLWVLEVPGSNPGETQVKSFRNQSASFQSFSTRFLKSYMKTRLTLSFHKITDFTDLEVGIYGTGSRKPAISLLLLVLSCRDLYCWKGNWILHLFPSILARFGSYGDNEKANAFSLSRDEKVLTQHFFGQTPEENRLICRSAIIRNTPNCIKLLVQVRVELTTSA